VCNLLNKLINRSINQIKTYFYNANTPLPNWRRIMTDTSQSFHCMRCRTVQSLACFVGMSWRAEPSDSQNDSELQAEGALTQLQTGFLSNNFSGHDNEYRTTRTQFLTHYKNDTARKIYHDGLLVSVLQFQLATLGPRHRSSAEHQLLRCYRN